MIALALFVIALIAGYFLFLRQDYVLIYKDLRPADASAIVAELDKEHVPHQLREGGTQILVPANQADAVRLAVIGAGIPSKGVEGFELFNNSDLGLTDFGQKIKFQRALQGELARTIMLTDGVVEARVHISMPDRTLFRGEQQQPKAAVTLIMRSPDLVTSGRIVGVQRLVAAAIPDLTVDDVVVLDGRGEVISQPSSPKTAEDAPAPQGLEALAGSIAQKLIPNRRVAVVIEHVLVEAAAAKPAAPPPIESTSADAAKQDSPPTESSAAARKHRVIHVWTDAGLAPIEQKSIRTGLVSADILDENDVVGLVFGVKPFPPAPTIHQTPDAPAAANVAHAAINEALTTPAAKPPTIAPAPATIDWSQVGLAGGVLVVLAILVSGVVLLIQIGRRRGSLAFETQRRLVDRLKLDLQSGLQRSANDAG